MFNEILPLLPSLNPASYFAGLDQADPGGHRAGVCHV